jgi:Ubiquitin carboxyl-terminal hydrolase
MHKGASPKKDSVKSHVYDIFRGTLQSQIQCLHCKKNSNTIDPMLDISLEMKNCKSLSQALELFTRPELLCKDNRYKCENCKELRDARKRITLHELPNSVTIQFKRFGYSKWGNRQKLSDHIKFEETLDLGAYTGKKSTCAKYNLTGVLVHSGNSCSSGHYYSYVEAPNGSWYCMNDSSVQQVSIGKVLGQNAYMLFYASAEAPKYSAMNKLEKPVMKSDEANAVQSAKRKAESESPKANKKQTVVKDKLADMDVKSNKEAKNAVLKGSPKKAATDESFLKLADTESKTLEVSPIDIKPLDIVLKQDSELPQPRIKRHRLNSTSEWEVKDLCDDKSLLFLIQTNKGSLDGDSNSRKLVETVNLPKVKVKAEPVAVKKEAKAQTSSKILESKLDAIEATLSVPATKATQVTKPSVATKVPVEAIKQEVKASKKSATIDPSVTETIEFIFSKKEPEVPANTPPLPALEIESRTSSLASSDSSEKETTKSYTRPTPVAPQSKSDLPQLQPEDFSRLQIPVLPWGEIATSEMVFQRKNFIEEMGRSEKRKRPSKEDMYFDLILGSTTSRGE